MLLEIDNSRTLDLENNWSVDGRTRHIETRQKYLCDMKEEGYLVVIWISGEATETDILTKNSSSPVFNINIRVHIED